MITSKTTSKIMKLVAKKAVDYAVSELLTHAVSWIISNQLGVAITLIAGPFAILCFVLYALYKCK